MSLPCTHCCPTPRVWAESGGLWRPRCLHQPHKRGGVDAAAWVCGSRSRPHGAARSGGGAAGEAGERRGAVDEHCARGGRSIRSEHVRLGCTRGARRAARGRARRFSTCAPGGCSGWSTGQPSGQLPSGVSQETMQEGGHLEIHTSHVATSWGGVPAIFPGFGAGLVTTPTPRARLHLLHDRRFAWERPSSYARA